jgi:hypothetical protein
MNDLDSAGFSRLKRIIGDAKAIPPIEPIFPVGKTNWWDGVRAKIYPQPVKLSPAVTAWKNSDLKRLLDGERDFSADSEYKPRLQSLRLVEARQKFWAEVRAGVRPHPRKSKRGSS